MKIERTILKKIIEGNASSEEQSDFSQWVNANDANRDYFEQMRSYYIDPVEAEARNSVLKSSSRNGHTIIRKQQRGTRRVILLSVISSAAILLVAFLIAYPQLSNTNEKSKIVVNATKIESSIVLPGGVVLRTENLDPANINSGIIHQNDSSLNEISYVEEAIKSNILDYHTITTPAGKSFSVVLSDGTKVYLNANSEFRYPTTFQGSASRTVYLKGEGYFDVVKNATPFEVKISGIKIKVYGTKFNVNDYDSVNVKTVLLSGRVGVSIDNQPDFVEKILFPNQLANVNRIKQDYEVLEVTPSDYLSWKDGIIKSYNSTLGDLIFKLKNWYGVDFQFTDSDSANLPITASFDSRRNIEEVLDAIEHISQVKFKKMKGGYQIN